MSSLNNVQRKLAEGTSSWLLFEFHCMRGDLFSEKYLTTPVGQILSGMFPGRVKAEVNHPYLNPIILKGRPPQLDFVISDNQDWKVAVETKWIINTPVTLAQIVWDLIRLELLAKNNRCTAYFIIAGFDKRIKEVLGKTHFYNADLKETNLITKKRVQTISLDLRKLDDVTKKFINEKLSRYKNITVPSKMNFTIPHSYPKESINLTFKTIVWRVNSIRNKHRTNSL